MLNYTHMQAGCKISLLTLTLSRAFTQLVADSQFSALGTVLISTLGSIHSTTAAIAEAHDLQPPVEPKVSPSGPVTSETRYRASEDIPRDMFEKANPRSSDLDEDFGEPVHRDPTAEVAGTLPSHVAVYPSAEGMVSTPDATRSPRPGRSTQKKSAIDELFEDLI
jgi:hypothetical protein